MSGYWSHDSSIVGVKATIGENTRVWQFCNIMDDTEIGKECNVGQGVFIESGVVIGDNVTIKNNISLYNGVVCEDNVFLGPNCVFTNVTNPRSFISKKNEFKQTIVRRGATIGANATIVCGHEIGQYSMIGAGTVVTKDVPDYALFVGNPGRKVAYVCRCGEKLIPIDGHYYCDKCKLEYEMIEDKLFCKMEGES